MSKIKSIIAREIKDSRGNPTVEVELETEKGSFVASVPSGASTGKNEAWELRDAEGPDGGRTDGKGVLNAIKNVNEIITPKLKGKNSEDQKEVDEIMIALDGTENKSKLGANAILAVSMAVCRAGAGSKKVPLYQHIASLRGGDSRRSNPGKDEIASHSLAMTIPQAMFNVLEGGRHVEGRAKLAEIPNAEGGGTTDNLDIQEFMVVPQKKTFVENLVLCNKIFYNLKENIEKSFGKAELGDEGGFAPKISKTEQALYLLKNAIDRSSPADECKIALDCAASQFYKDGKYKIDGREFTKTELSEFYKDLVNRFPIISIEDPYAEEDWQGWQLINSKFQIPNSKILIIGDDLTTTNIKKIKEAHNKNVCNGVILKLNQIGTVSETIEACNLAKSFDWKTIVSHRSGETMDDFIADLAVGLSADFIKSGSPAKPERMVKYKRLMEIEKEI